MGSSSKDEASTTRYLETTRGTLRYSEVADIVADYLAELLEDIARGTFNDRDIDSSLVLEFHRRILQPIVPQMAGKWRPVDVSVGKHVPPRYYMVPTLMATYAANLEARMFGCGSNVELQIELLAYAEGEFLTIHPFEDFNGRAVRAFLMEVIERLDLPPIEVSVPRETDQFEDYKACLRDYDNLDHRSLQRFWVDRFEAL